MSWESEGEDGDREEQTPGQGQPLFELPLQDPQLQMTFLSERKEMERDHYYGPLGWCHWCFNAKELSLCHKHQKGDTGR